MSTAGADSGGSASTRPTSSTGSRSTSAPAPAPAAAPSPSSPRSSASSASSGGSDAADAAAADPLLDPRADAADAAWAARHLSAGAGAGAGAPETDVRLACPSCFALLCVAAQAHVEYAGQWRAVFVRGCRVSDSEVVRVRVEGADEAEQERYRPVECERCRTEVGVLDEDDVYHFCNVLS